MSSVINGKTFIVLLELYVFKDHAFVLCHTRMGRM